MNKLSQAMMDLMRVDELSSQDSLIHRLHPLAKLMVTIIYILTVVSFPLYSLTGMIPMLLYPLFVSEFSGIPLGLCLKRLLMLLLLVCAVGIWNPILDRRAVMTIGSLVVTAGMVSFLTLMLKGILALLASFLLIATTGIEDICYALRLLHIPSMIVTLIMITFRYISLLMEEAGTMMEAYQLRAPGQKGVHISAWGSFLGQLLLRSMDRATELYESMQLRGFAGEFYYARGQGAAGGDYLYVFICILLFLLCRLVNIVYLLGNAII